MKKRVAVERVVVEMNFRLLAKSLMLFVSLALILYGVSGTVNEFFGWQESLLNDVWKLLAIAIGLSAIAAYAFPGMRGIRRGDQLVSFIKRKHDFGGRQVSVADAVLVTALENGRAGEKIKVRFGNGLQAEGVIQSYAGTLSPPSIQLTETERVLGS